MIIIGALLVLAGLGLGAAAAALGLLAAAQRGDGYLSAPEETYSVSSYAITSAPAEIGSGVNTAGELGSLRLRAEATDRDLFIGIGPEDDVDRYLAGVASSEIDAVRFNPFAVDYDQTPGTAPSAPPGEQDFWTVSSEGSGTREITWTPAAGEWTVVVMNADASPSVTADLQAGLRSDLFGAGAWWLLIGAVVLVLGGAALILAGILAGRSRPTATRGPGGYPPARAVVPVAGPLAGPVAGPDGPAYPARLYGELDAPLSRWLWLVKWFLAIPHYIVLAFLWIAFWVATVAAGFAILFTGRYPRALFDFNVGVIRWSWRVTFYATGVLGTDRYPPFSLDPENYPADFGVDHPERLSRGLVLVKWWLLVIPHALVVGAFSGTALVLARAPRYLEPGSMGADFGRGPDWNGGPGGPWAAEWVTAGISLLGLLVLIAAVALLFTRRYPRQLFDFIMGLQRWSYRVLAYTALMRDEYPPFRLDQGPADPRDVPPGAGIEDAGSQGTHIQDAGTQGNGTQGTGSPDAGDVPPR